MSKRNSPRALDVSTPAPVVADPFAGMVAQATATPEAKPAKAKPVKLSEAEVFKLYGVRLHMGGARYRVKGTAETPVITRMLESKGCPQIAAPEAGLLSAAKTLLAKLPAQVKDELARMATGGAQGQVTDQA